jgi:3-hydroxyacyl-[acyl-carrier-protein] dehydratase
MRPASYPTAFDALVHPARVGRTPDAVTVTLRVPVAAATDVLAGHYPGFPILPGVLIIDCLRQAVSAATSDRVRLTAVQRLRLVSPLLPGDEMTFTTTISGDTAIGRGVRVDGRVAAEIRAGFERVSGHA